MANELVKRNLGSSSLTTFDDDLAARLLSGIEDSQATTMVAGDGVDLIKMDKGTGAWGMGQADDPMQVGSNWLINILSVCHGSVCWSDYKGTRKNERLGEVMVPMSEPKPPKPAPIDGFPFKEQRSFEAYCLNGEDEGRKVQFKNGSVGTMKAMKKLEDAIKAQLRNNRAFPNPVVQFEQDSYKHGDYGRIWNPIFNIVDWADFEGNLLSELDAPEQVKATAPAPKPAPAAAAKPAIKAKPPLNVVPKAPVQEVLEPEAADTATAVRGPRRRPPAA